MGDVLRCELEIPDPKLENLVKRCFQIELAEKQQRDAGAETSGPQQSARGSRSDSTLKQMSMNAANDGGTRVNMRVNFAPLRPFASAANLVFTKVTGGGRWRFNL